MDNFVQIIEIYSIEQGLQLWQIKPATIPLHGTDSIKFRGEKV